MSTTESVRPSRYAPPTPPGVVPRVGPEPVLTTREQQVLALIGQGYSNREISEELFLSINSVKTYIRSAYRKIGVLRRTQAVIWFMSDGRDRLDDVG